MGKRSSAATRSETIAVSISAPPTPTSGIQTTDLFDNALDKLEALVDLAQVASWGSQALKDGTLSWLTMLIDDQLEVIRREVKGETSTVEATP